MLTSYFLFFFKQDSLHLNMNKLNNEYADNNNLLNTSKQNMNEVASLLEFILCNS